MAKNILFLAHSYNDIDHYLPLIAALKKSEDFEPIVFFIRPKEAVQLNKAHQWVMEQLAIRNVSFDDIFGPNPIICILLYIYRYCIRKAGFTPLRALIRSRCIYKSLIKIIYIAIDRLFKKYPQYLFSSEAIERFVDRESIAMAIIDTQKIKKKPPYEGLRFYTAFVIINYCKGKGIPVFMVPHGATTILDCGRKDGSGYNFFHSDKLGLDDKSSFFQPDVLGLNLESDRVLYSRFIGEKTKVEVLGAIRYDYSWNEKIQKISVDTLDTDLKKSGFAILYIVSPLDASMDKKIHKDIIGLVKIFSQIELWIKTHPRYPWLFRLDDGVLLSNVSPKIRIFRNEIDTNALIYYSDLVISPLSSTLSQAVIANKPVILYDWWKTYMNFTGETAYDNAPCVLKASSPEQLHAYCQQIIDGKRPKDNEVEEFYKTRISMGLKREESIIPRYIDVVKHFSI